MGEPITRNQLHPQISTIINTVILHLLIIHSQPRLRRRLKQSHTSVGDNETPVMTVPTVLRARFCIRCCSRMSANTVTVCFDSITVDARVKPS